MKLVEMLKENGLVARLPFGIAGLCAATIVMLWTVLIIEVDRSKTAAIDKARSDASNLVMAFRENVRRTVGAVDQLMITIIAENNETENEYRIPLGQEFTNVAWNQRASRDQPGGRGRGRFHSRRTEQERHFRPPGFRYHLDPAAPNPISASRQRAQLGQVTSDHPPHHARDGSFGGTIDVAVDRSISRNSSKKSIRPKRCGRSGRPRWCRARPPRAQ